MDDVSEMDRSLREWTGRRAQWKRKRSVCVAMKIKAVQVLQVKVLRKKYICICGGQPVVRTPGVENANGTDTIKMPFVADQSIRSWLPLLLHRSWPWLASSTHDSPLNLNPRQFD